MFFLAFGVNTLTSLHMSTWWSCKKMEYKCIIFSCHLNQKSKCVGGLPILKKQHFLQPDVISQNDWRRQIWAWLSQTAKCWLSASDVSRWQWVSSPPSPTPTLTPSAATAAQWVGSTRDLIWRPCVTGSACSRPRPYKDTQAQWFYFDREVEEGSFHSKSLMSLRWQWLPWRGGGGWGVEVKIKRNKSSLEAHCLHNQTHWLGGSCRRTEAGELLCRHLLGINCSGCPGLLSGTAVSTAERFLPLRGWWLSAAFYGEQQSKKIKFTQNTCINLQLYVIG